VNKSLFKKTSFHWNHCSFAYSNWWSSAGVGSGRPRWYTFTAISVELKLGVLLTCQSKGNLYVLLMAM